MICVLFSYFKQVKIYIIHQLHFIEKIRFLEEVFFEYTNLFSFHRFHFYQKTYEKMLVTFVLLRNQEYLKQFMYSCRNILATQQLYTDIKLYLLSSVMVQEALAEPNATLLLNEFSFHQIHFCQKTHEKMSVTFVLLRNQEYLKQCMYSCRNILATQQLQTAIKLYLLSYLMMQESLWRIKCQLALKGLINEYI